MEVFYRAKERIEKALPFRFEKKTIPPQDNELVELVAQIEARQSPSFVTSWVPITGASSVPEVAADKVITALRPIVPAQEHQDSAPSLSELHALTQDKSRITSIGKGGESKTDTNLIKATTQDTTAFLLETIDAPDLGLIGIRASEAGRDLSVCADALTVFAFRIENGSGNSHTVRVVFVADGVGSTILGDVAARVLVNKAQEYCIKAVKNGDIKDADGVAEVMSQAAAYADAYLHSIGKDTLEQIAVKRSASLPQLQREGYLAGMSNPQTIASSTLLGLAVIDDDAKTDPLKILYLDGGDGGIGVTAGPDYDNYHSEIAYKSGAAPAQINYGAGTQDASQYREKISAHEFIREPEMQFTITVRTDGLDKLPIGTRERTPEEMLKLAFEIGRTSNPVQVLAQLADRVTDDATYLILRS